MFENGPQLNSIAAFMKSHWPSKVKDEWQVSLDEYPGLIEKAVADLAAGKTKGHHLVRLAGISGAGKTTQLLPAAENYFKKQNLDSILVAARIFAPYHPHYEEILNKYGPEKVRAMTDEVSTTLMVMVLAALISQGYDIILDVTLLDPAIESVFAKLLEENHYAHLLLLIAASPEATAKHLAGRSWRHPKEVEEEFIRATSKAMAYYAKDFPELHAIIWNVYEADPVHNGPIKNALAVFEKYSAITDIPENDADARRAAKVALLESMI